MKAIILARVSTKDQELFGHSLEAQVVKLKEYTKRNNFEVVKVFSFSESAGHKIRKKFEEVITYLKENKDVRILLTENVDRATRNFRDAVDLDEMRINDGLEIHFVQDGFYINANATGNQMFMWEAKVFLAKQYLNRLSDDVKRSIEQKIQNGQWNSKAPIGYLNIKDEETEKSNIIIDKNRYFLIRKAFEDYSTGNYSLSDITRRLKEFGLRNNTKSNNPLHKSQVHYMLNNPFYYGVMKVKDKLYPHIYKPIIDKFLFDKCQEVRKKLSKKAFKYSYKPFIFKGLIKCAYCGCMISTDRKKDKYNYLFCSKYKGDCEAVRIREEDIVNQINNILKQIVIPENVLDEMVEHLKKSNESKEQFRKAQENTIHDEYNKIQSKLKVLFDMALEKSITQDEYVKKASELKQRQLELNDKLKRVIIADESYSITLITLLNICSRAPELFESSKVEQKRQLINFLLSNLKLRGKILEFELKKPFDVLVNLQNCKNRSEWLAIINDIRTEIYRI
jgi:DNA invertase Pin-like site-specific DNA recombinase